MSVIYNETQDAIIEAAEALKKLAWVVAGKQDKTNTVTKLYEERTTVKDQRLHWRDPGGYLRVSAFRIDLPDMPYGLRRLWVVQQWLSGNCWDEAENELEEEWFIYLPNDFANDAGVIRRAIERFDDLAPELAQKVYDRATEQFKAEAEGNIAALTAAAAMDDEVRLGR